MTADQRAGAFLMTLGLSHLVSRLHEIDQADYRDPHRATH